MVGVGGDLSLLSVEEQTGNRSASPLPVIQPAQLFGAGWRTRQSRFYWSASDGGEALLSNALLGSDVLMFYILFTGRFPLF